MSDDQPTRWKDPVIEAYRSGVDMTLVEENLKLTVEQRILKMMEWQRFAEAVRQAGERARAKR